MKKILICASFCIIAPLCASASQISSMQACVAAESWISRNPKAFDVSLDGCVEQVKTCKGSDGKDAFHLVCMRGGGFVVMPADDGVFPIIGVSDGVLPEENIDNPFWALVKADIQQRVAVVRQEESNLVKSRRNATQPNVSALTASISNAKTAWSNLLYTTHSGAIALGISNVNDVRVAPLLLSKWNQSTHNNYAVPYGKNCFNYYTPSNYVCGCVATAGAQLMRFHRFPVDSIEAYTKKCKVYGVAVDKSMLGGVYSWDDMPLDPAAGVSDKQRQAIGKLCYDIGVTVGMNWSNAGSAAPLYAIVNSLKSIFGYANAMGYTINNDTVSPSYLQAATLANLDAGYPVLFGINGSNGGHAIVGDGYGYSSGILYVHLNMGWGGIGDIWYDLPDIQTQYYNFTVLNTILYNIFPTETGDLLTGRVLSESGNPMPGATVTATYNGMFADNAVTDDKGIYAFHLTGGRTYSLTVSNTSGSAAKDVLLPKSVSTLYSGEFFYPGSGAPGNSWGNELTLSVTARRFTSCDIILTMGLPCLQLSFDGESGETYVIQTKNALTDSAWIDLETITTAVNGVNSMNIPMTNRASSGFYRIVSP